MKKFFKRIIAPDYSIKEHTLFEKLEFLFFLFILGGMIGFVYEEIYFLFQDGMLEYRGFLYGPWLPVYGCGGVLIYLLFNRLRKYPWAIFLLTMLLTGVLEYLTGFVLWELFHQHWWDYTTHPLNIHGYTCLDAVLSFAIAGLLLIYLIAPRFFKALDRLRPKTRHILFGCLAAVFFTDVVLSNVFLNPLGVVAV